MPKSKKLKNQKEEELEILEDDAEDEEDEADDEKKIVDEITVKPKDKRRAVVPKTPKALADSILDELDDQRDYSY